MRGPKSRAGLIAYPVGPPSERPMPNTNKAYGKAFRLANESAGPAMQSAPKARTKVATISVIKLCEVLRMAGELQNTPRMALTSMVTSKCFFIGEPNQVSTNNSSKHLGYDIFSS